MGGVTPHIAAATLYAGGVCSVRSCRTRQITLQLADAARVRREL